ncbi:hypothetical protein HDU97_005027 [Phlyctochytrium planicorne]|nr:hypothetical protein HDU97_005027 [Phlyctochytrium planicorne]
MASSKTLPSSPSASLSSATSPSKSSSSSTTSSATSRPQRRHLKSFFIASLTLLCLPSIAIADPQAAIPVSPIPSVNSNAYLEAIPPPNLAKRAGEVDAAIPPAPALADVAPPPVPGSGNGGEPGKQPQQPLGSPAGNSQPPQQPDVMRAKDGHIMIGEERHQAELEALAHELGIEDYRQLTPNQIAQLDERLKFRTEHKGHEKQHAQMALILMGGLIFFQFLLLFWKKTHPKSFQLASLVGLWLVPPAIGFSAGNYRYILFWILFSAANGVVVRKALFETPMQSSTPKLVYRWYSYVYNASVAVGGFGYAVVVLTFFRVPFTFGVSEQTELNMFKGGLVILFYGLYFGTLGRDFVDRISDRMAIRTGYFNRTGFPKKHLRPNVCAICGDSTDSGRTGGVKVKLQKLACDHTYHEECIRKIVRKKYCCPYCKEKVDLKAFSRHAWDTTQLLYLNLLDALRYLIVWNPILFLTIHFVFNVLGYD